jgi:nucleoid-associated protein YgaU
MRLEYKVGVIVAVAVIGLGTWFFITRDRASDNSVARVPDVSRTDAAKPSSTAKQASPQPTPTAHRPAPALPKPVVRQDLPRAPMSVTTRPSQPPPTLSLNPDRSTSPGIRSETPLAKAESSIDRPATFTDKTPTPIAKPFVPTGDAGATPIATAAPTRVAPPASPKPVVAPEASSPTPTAASAAPTAKTHVMKQGDTLQGIAIKYYGAAKYTSLILDANKQFADPKRIPVGAKITIPPAPTAPSDAARAAALGTPSTRPAADIRMASAEPRRQPSNTKPYVVKKGDNWQRIAEQFMGDKGRWTELFEMNKRYAGESPHNLRVGDTIYVPVATASPAPGRTLMSTMPKP